MPGVVARALRQDMRQVDFGLRRFRLRPGPARGVLEASGRAFLTGLNASVEPDRDALGQRVSALEPELRGFALEGAGMGCALLDLLLPARRGRVAALLNGPAADYPHLVHVGIGWAYARLRLRPSRNAGTDPLLRWLAWDGFGFHQGFFHTDRTVGRHRVEPGIGLGPRHIRDQGLGRALWFCECADPDGVALRIAEFPVERQADLWSGVGLAATYAGGADAGELARLADLSGPLRAHLAQGCAFACAARRVSGIVPAHTDKAAEVLAGTSTGAAADWTDQALGRLPAPSTLAHYQRWRAEIRYLWERKSR
ncbi:MULTISPECIES: DUF1702 family protein [unclassified Amycolatopsis]|uniref:DUF1702 family protein n=1 Tax=unclassified Amycolatopsis TaxID=2618356 RepID=UPI00106EAA6C|nr:MULTISPECIES: DUF1702 family protein [unclassified Amycolatopsis]